MGLFFQRRTSTSVAHLFTILLQICFFFPTFHALCLKLGFSFQIGLFGLSRTSHQFAFEVPTGALQIFMAESVLLF